MRVLPDESLPSGLKDLLQDHDVTTVPERGWRGAKNGDLLSQASREFDVFLTADQSEYQAESTGCWYRYCRSCGSKQPTQCIQAHGRPNQRGDPERSPGRRNQGGRITSGCTSRGTELKMLHPAFSIINVCPAGDPQCSANNR